MLHHFVVFLICKTGKVGVISRFIKYFVRGYGYRTKEIIEIE